MTQPGTQMIEALGLLIETHALAMGQARLGVAQAPG